MMLKRPFFVIVVWILIHIWPKNYQAVPGDLQNSVADG
jgi:hypothetical protein